MKSSDIEIKDNQIYWIRPSDHKRILFKLGNIAAQHHHPEYFELINKIVPRANASLKKYMYERIVERYYFSLKEINGIRLHPDLHINEAYVLWLHNHELNNHKPMSRNELIA